ncbi:hypothetical protein B0H67DRAFT_595051 [Lasiosphaeris hirsuta]|uniref:Uncharacterized protein n=1 Tax=Lasiosphaeris hirsuta TaxID=260670 RepID=A0AA39ZSC9_9PEZI|nr:hypothetical protein B0H67DRAFT_595051 [Lasiosphaeris hirsuta]
MGRWQTEWYRHVSFEVGVEQGLANTPELRIKRWLPGLCFFRGRERRSVVFSWPDDLKAVRPFTDLGSSRLKAFEDQAKRIHF